MSDTPETDKLIRTYHTVIGTDAIGLASKLTLKCMELERERDEAVQALRNIRADWGGMVIDDGCYCSDCEFLRPIDFILNKYRV